MDLPRTELEVFPLCLGGNVFGWTLTPTEADRLTACHGPAH